MRGIDDEEPVCGVVGVRGAPLPFDCSGEGEERLGSGDGEAVVTTTVGLRVPRGFFPLPLPAATGELVAVLRLDAAGGGGVSGLSPGTSASSGF